MKEELIYNNLKTNDMKTTISKKDIINVIGKHYMDNFYIETIKKSKEYKVHVRGKYVQLVKIY